MMCRMPRGPARLLLPAVVASLLSGKVGESAGGIDSGVSLARVVRPWNLRWVRIPAEGSAHVRVGRRSNTI
jgi:hypothetical protein